MGYSLPLKKTDVLPLLTKIHHPRTNPCSLDVYIFLLFCNWKCQNSGTSTAVPSISAIFCLALSVEGPKLGTSCGSRTWNLEHRGGRDEVRQCWSCIFTIKITTGTAHERKVWTWTCVGVFLDCLIKFPWFSTVEFKERLRYYGF